MVDSLQGLIKSEVYHILMVGIKTSKTMLKINRCSRTSKKMATGTKEWADSNVNLVNGCENNCRYCYAKKMAIRFKRKTENTWHLMDVNPKVLLRSFNKRQGRIMFPSSHDITPQVLEPCLIVLSKLLNAGNSVLITTKPRITIIQKICAKFNIFKDNIQFRFTIGSNDDATLQYWEPGASLFEERLAALKFAFNQNFHTSVSIEPFLDFDPIPLVTVLSPYVTDTIWLGLMHYIDRNGLNAVDELFYEKIRKNYEYVHVQQIYRQLQGNSKVRWKDSIKKMLNLSS